MPFEDFDNKIKQAAEQHHPNYDEKAWTKMQKLLDQHLPEKKDHRRTIFFLLFFLLLGGGTWLVISKPWQQNDQTLGVENTSRNKTVTSSSDDSTESSKDKTATGETAAEKDRDKKSTAVPVMEDPVVISDKKNDLLVKDPIGPEQGKVQSPVVSKTKEKTQANKTDRTRRGKNSKADELAIDVTDPGKISKGKEASANNTIVSPTENNNNDATPKNDKRKPADEPSVVKNNGTGNTIIDPKKDDIKEKLVTKEDKTMVKKSVNKKSNSFFFSFSAGPDISSVGLDKPGKIRLAAGAGVGYTIKNRLTLRAGFYSGRKVYSANKEDYKPAVSPMNYNYLDNITANCKVYEIPVSLAWNFSRSEKHNLFAGVGLSSYIMKKEEYVYEYKYQNGNTYSYPWTIKDQNKHYFSVLTLSGGYQRRINKTFSLAAEPYIKLPLTGIGFGNVKLNSAGILFSVNISPFQPGVKK